jgi:hypothetical protein
MMRRAFTTALTVFAACGFAACGDEARVTAPSGAAAFARFVTIGTGFTMGEQSAGVVYESQVTAWPAQLAARVDAPFRVPALRAPGCTPPLVAPLSLYRNLAGSIVAGASGCSGRLGSDSLPASNVAMSGATAWDAFHTSPRSFVTQAASLDQVRYPMILPALQTQLQATLGQNPTLVAVELGAGEVLRAATSGLVTVATSYTQKTAWTLVPSSVFAPVFDSIADSVKASGARAVFVGVPPLLSLPAWRVGDVLWQHRAALATQGVDVHANCQGSENLLHTVRLLPPLVAAARSAGTRQSLSCADRADEADGVLTPSDAALITQTIASINAAIKAAADKRQLAYVEIPMLATDVAPVSLGSWVQTLLSSDQPFGRYLSLDGVQPSVQGHALVADRVAAALNTTYGWSIPIPTRPALARVTR